MHILFLFFIIYYLENHIMLNFPQTTGNSLLLILPYIMVIQAKVESLDPAMGTNSALNLLMFQKRK